MLNLNKQQKNEIFKIIEQKGLNTNLFSWIVHVNKSHVGHLTQYVKHSVTALVFRREEGDFRFTFEQVEPSSNPYSHTYMKYRSSLVPQLIPGEDVVFSEDWDGVMLKFQDWLDVIKYELEERDLWKELPRGQALTAIPANYSNDEKFSVEERRLITERLSKIEKFILESNQPSGASAIKIQQTFIYLQQRTETASKLDWKNIFAGAIVGLILEKAVDNAPEVMKLCNELLSPFFQKLFQLTHAN